MNKNYEKIFLNSDHAVYRALLTIKLIWFIRRTAKITFSQYHHVLNKTNFIPFNN